MILVTGAGGKTGRAVVHALAQAGAHVRAFAYHADQIKPLRELGAAEAIHGDMRDPALWPHTMAAINAVYHICPNMASDEEAIGRLAIAAARAAGVEHFVYHSVLHPQTEAMPHHWHKLRVEEALFESVLAFTILQPAPYMQNILAGWDAIVSRGVYRVPYAVETRLSLVDLGDVAQAAAIVLTQPGHRGATYELVGTEPLTQLDVAATLTEALGRSVRAERLELDIWERQARAVGLGDYQVQTLMQMFRYYEAYGLCGNPRVLTWLLGRSPTSLAAFVQMSAHPGSR